MANALEAPRWRVKYVIESQSLSPTSRVGNVRLFTVVDAELITREIRRIEAQRQGGEL